MHVSFFGVPLLVHILFEPFFAPFAEEITQYPMYLTLNLARVLAFREEGRVLSKKEGGE